MAPTEPMNPGSGQPTFTSKQEGEKLTGTYGVAFGQASLTGTIKGGELMRHLLDSPGPTT